MLISFLFLHKNICCGNSLEAPHRGASNKYPQHMFSWRNKKNIMWIPPLICSYECKNSWHMSCYARSVSSDICIHAVWLEPLVPLWRNFASLHLWLSSMCPEKILLRLHEQAGWSIDLDKSGYQVNSFISRRKHMLWVLIRSASVRCF